jgi:hypothetical protein
MVQSLRHGSRSVRAQQRGAAMLLTLVLLGLLIAIFVVVLTNDLVRQNTRQRQTAEALAKAKEALIGFAVGGDIGAACGSPWDCRRPGELPCPDLDDDGSSDSCPAQGDRLGRLPWRTLDLPDLRDGDGERLWYAVSNKYKNSPRTQCSNPTQAGCLNSESPGTILLSDKDGTVVNDGSDPNPPSGVIAVVISPGTVLQREGAGSPQDRTCAGGACTPTGDTAGVCTSANPKLTAKCNPVNYLDVVSGGEDNADFIDGDPFNGFMNGPVYTGNRRQIVNDTVLAIEYDDIMPLAEKRVAKEAMNCITAFGAANEGRYPWASSMADSSGASSYGDTPRYRFGRLPDTFDSTLLGTEINVLTISLGNLVCALLPGLCNKPEWPATASCSIRSDGWWTNWKDQVFYGVGEGFRPEVNVIALNLLPPLINLDLLPSSGTACTDDADNCLRVNPPTAAVDKRVVVIVAGRPLAGASQPQKPTSRTRSNPGHYLEGANPGNSPTSGSFLIFEQQPRSGTFNDTVVFQ